MLQVRRFDALSAPVLAEANLAREMGQTARRSKVVRAPYPMGIEVDYGSAIIGVVDAARLAMSSLEQELPRLLELGTKEAAARVRSLAARAYTTFSTAISTGFLEDLTRRHALKLVAWERGTWQRIFGAATGASIPTLGRGPNVAAVAEAFVVENVSLIKSIAEDLIDQIEKDATREMANRAITTDAPSAKKQPRTAKGIIENRVEKAKTRARGAARDQVGKSSGRLAAQMQQDVGINEFEWLSRRDSRVRKLHRQLDGRTFKYPSGHPTEGLPGEPPGCRCYPVPKFGGGIVINVGKRPVPQPPKRTKRAPPKLPAPKRTRMLPDPQRRRLP